MDHIAWCISSKYARWLDILTNPDDKNAVNVSPISIQELGPEAIKQVLYVLCSRLNPAEESKLIRVIYINWHDLYIAPTVLVRSNVDGHYCGRSLWHAITLDRRTTHVPNTKSVQYLTIELIHLRM